MKPSERIVQLTRDELDTGRHNGQAMPRTSAALNAVIRYLNEQHEAAERTERKCEGLLGVTGSGDACVGPAPSIEQLRQDLELLERASAAELPMDAGVSRLRGALHELAGWRKRG